MNKIEYVQEGGNNPYFFVKVTTDEAKPVLDAVCEATFQAQSYTLDPDRDRIRFHSSVENVLALQATGFAWSEDAAKTAIQILAREIRKVRSDPQGL